MIDEVGQEPGMFGVRDAKTGTEAGREDVVVCSVKCSTEINRNYNS